MSYLAVLPLSTVKDYLRVEHNDSDEEIKRMIQSALKLIERKTNILFVNIPAKVYLLHDGCVRVYDYPINTIDDDLPATVTRTNYSDYSLFEDTNTDNKTLTLDVGFVGLPDDVEDLMEGALEMIDHWYYKKEGAERIGLIPDSVMEVIGTNQRFIL